MDTNESLSDRNYSVEVRKAKAHARQMMFRLGYLDERGRMRNRPGDETIYARLYWACIRSHLLVQLENWDLVSDATDWAEEEAYHVAEAEDDRQFEEHYR